MVRKLLLPLFIILVVTYSCSNKSQFPSDEDMFPFLISYTGENNITDISYLLDPPAGKYGFIRVEGEHFVTDNGPIKFNATNLTAGANFPTHEQAERLAARLARFGINCVRLHYMDHNYGPAFFGLPNEPSIFANDGSDRNFNPILLDRLEYLISKFKEKGIYVDVNLHVDRGYKQYNETNKYYQGKEKEYAKDLLTHINPYTGLSLAEDPCVAQVELDNEDSMFDHYSNGSFSMKGWPTRDQLRDSLDFNEKILFLHKLEKLDKDHWNGLYNYLKDSIGVKVPITSTQVTYSYPFTLADMDYYDNHAYWLHPSLGIYWTIGNTAMVNDINGGNLSKLANGHYAGKPYTISEINNPYPNFYGAEGQPMIHAFAAYQGWDGIYAYSWNNRQNVEQEHVGYFFSYSARTDALAHFISCAAMFLRGDVKTADECLELPVTESDYEKLWLDDCKKCYKQPSSIYSELTGGNAKYNSSLLHRTKIKMNPTVIQEFPNDSIGTTKKSSTGEIEWNQDDKENGVFIVRTENSKFFTGFPKGRTFDLGDNINLEIGKTKLGWATISITSMDANGFKPGSRILLAATGFTHNSGAKFTIQNDAEGNPTSKISCRNQDWGHAPVITEGINATITLPTYTGETKCWALDERGEHKTEIPIKKNQKETIIEINSKYKTIWYEIKVE